MGRLQREPRERVDGEVRFGPASRAACSTDASSFRQVPVGVVVPRSVDAAGAAVVCRENGAPVPSRDGGTSLAGQCANAAVPAAPGTGTKVLSLASMAAAAALGAAAAIRGRLR